MSHQGNTIQWYPHVEGNKRLLGLMWIPIYSWDDPLGYYVALGFLFGEFRVYVYYDKK